MSGDRVRFDVQAPPKSAPEYLLRELLEFRRRGGDPRPAFKKMAAAFRLMERERFDEAGWEPYAESTQKRTGRSQATLVDTRTLLDSLTKQRAKWSVERFSRTDLVVGTRDPVAHLHMYGTARKLPRREFIRTGLIQHKWFAILEDFLAGQKK